MAGLMATGLSAVFFGFGTNSDGQWQNQSRAPAPAAPESTPATRRMACIESLPRVMHRADGDRGERLRAPDRLAPAITSSSR